MDEIKARVIIGGKAIEKPIVSLVISDSIGFLADSCGVEIRDISEKIVMPKLGETMQVSINVDQFKVVGEYVVSGGSYSKGNLEIHGKSFDVTSKLKSMENHRYDGPNLYAVFKAVADRNNIQALLSESLKSIPISEIYQWYESDLNFIVRLTKDYFCYFKQRKNQIAIGLLSDKTNSSGKELKPILVSENDVMNWQYKKNESKVYKSVKAEYYNLDNGSVETYSTGSGEPVLVLKELFPDLATAKGFEVQRYENSR